MEPTNSERISRIDGTLREYVAQRDSSYRDGDYDEDDVRDILADLMHWCQANDIDFDNALSFATDNYSEEKLNTCSECGEPNDNGDGYNGLCGNCADKEVQP